MKIFVASTLALVAVAIAWHIELSNAINGERCANLDALGKCRFVVTAEVNPLTDIVTLKMPAAHTFGITDPTEVAGFNWGRNFTAVPESEHYLNIQARQKFDLYAILLPYRTNVVDQSPSSIEETDLRSENSQTHESGDRHFKGFSNYKNARFGFAIQYPASFISELAPENGDGITFTSSDREATLVVAGGNNDNATLEQYYETARESIGTGLSYNKLGTDWFVITWEQGETIGYEKMFVGAASHNSFTFTFPKNQRTYYDATVVEIEKSFLPGQLNQSW